MLVEILLVSGVMISGSFTLGWLGIMYDSLGSLSFVCSWLPFLEALLSSSSSELASPLAPVLASQVPVGFWRSPGDTLPGLAAVEVGLEGV